MGEGADHALGPARGAPQARDQRAVRDAEAAEGEPGAVAHGGELAAPGFDGAGDGRRLLGLQAGLGRVGVGGLDDDGRGQECADHCSPGQDGRQRG